jgi:hypothetical protein
MVLQGKKKKVVKEDKWDAKCAFIKLLDRHQFDRLRYGSRKRK